MKPIQGLREIEAEYDGFIFDVWGTLYDGGALYPDALEVLRQLKNSGKKSVILSNAPRRATTVVGRLERLNVPSELYQGVVTSGELTFQKLVSKTDEAFQSLGERCFVIGGEAYQELLEGTGFRQVATVGDADWVLAAGPFAATDQLEAYEALLAEMRQRDLAMICANPDLAVISGGQRNICAGLIAERYQVLGGNVTFVGKPWADVFIESCRLFGLAPSARVLMVGDNMATDITGAAKSGLHALLLKKGIHRAELGAEGDSGKGAGAGDRLSALMSRYSATPTYVAAELRW